MMIAISILLFMASAAGLVLFAAQTVYLRRFLRRPTPMPTGPLPGISVLKPLSGLDDGLEENLQSFAVLDYPAVEVLLGFKSERDAALPLARAMVARWPQRFRIVFQRGTPGLNPKVNQLITLAQEAQHDVLVVSDASVRVDAGFLPEIAAQFERPEVGLVTHAVVGSGEQTLGSFCDNVRLTTYDSTGPVATQQLAQQDIVLGKSMAFRRSDLDALGGFESVKDVLSEDFVLGRRVSQQLRKRVVIARNIPLTISQHRTIQGFVQRYGRFAILQRHAAGIVVFSLQTLMNPAFLGLVAFLLAPSVRAAVLLATISFARSAISVYQMRLMRPEKLAWWGLFLVPVSDLLSGWAWVHGLLHDRVEWRGHALQVTAGTRLVPIATT